jgi:hypothetical protein
MTRINKTVRRHCNRPVFDGGYKNLIVAIEPGDMIAVKTIRSRKWYRITIQNLYERLVWSYSMQEQRAYQKKVKELVKAGLSKREARKQARG